MTIDFDSLTTFSRVVIGVWLCTILWFPITIGFLMVRVIRAPHRSQVKRKTSGFVDDPFISDDDRTEA